MGEDGWKVDRRSGGPARKRVVTLTDTWRETTRRRRVDDEDGEERARGTDCQHTHLACAHRPVCFLGTMTSTIQRAISSKRRSDNNHKADKRKAEHLLACSLISTQMQRIERQQVVSSNQVSLIQINTFSGVDMTVKR